MDKGVQPFNFEDMREAAAKRIPELISILDSTMARVDPINLLCQLSAIKLSHPSDEHPDTEEMGKWQAPLEYLAWRALYRAYRPGSPTYVDGTVLETIETTLDELFVRASVVIAEPVDHDDELAKAKEDVVFKLRMDALHVRGEGTPDEIEGLAQAIYGPHDTWFLENLGFTISDAVVIVRRILALMSTKISAAKKVSHDRAAQFSTKFTLLVSSDPNNLSDEDRDLRTEIESLGIAETADRAACYEFFAGFNDIASFSADELATTSSDVDPNRISAFLNRMSRRYGEPVPEPELLGFNPMSERPLILADDRYFVPVPPTLYEALMSTYHFDLWGDTNYRATYDKARASWLEEQAIRSFQVLLPNCQAYWNLTYGPKKARKELDGLVLH